MGLEGEKSLALIASAIRFEEPGSDWGDVDGRQIGAAPSGGARREPPHRARAADGTGLRLNDAPP